MVPESDWHKERQDWLRSEVMKNKEHFNVKKFESALEVAELIKQV